MALSANFLFVVIVVVVIITVMINNTVNYRQSIFSATFSSVSAFES